MWGRCSPPTLPLHCPLPPQILGAAARGFDPTDPSAGAPPEMAQIVNDNAVKSSLGAYAEWGTPEFEHSANAITRHVVEEFSMFRFFLPEVGGEGGGGYGVGICV